MLQVGKTAIRNSLMPPQVIGTAGCALVAAGDVNADRRFLLTCAHVVRPPRHPELEPQNDPARWNVVVDGMGNRIGSILASTTEADGVDAAIVELDKGVELDPALGALGTPAGAAWFLGTTPGSLLRGLGSRTAREVQTSVRERRPITMRPTDWRGDAFDWPLKDQIFCDRCSEEGDSGAVFMNQSNLVVGMVVGADADHTIITPIKAIFDHFQGRFALSFQPFVQAKPRQLVAPVAPPTPPATAPAPVGPGMRPWPGAVWGGVPAVDSPSAATTVLAWTLWGEAFTDWRNGRTADSGPLGEIAYRAVAEVIVNRVHRGGWWGSTIETVCKHADPNTGTFQFTCWDPVNNAGNIAQMGSPTVRATEGFAAAESIARHTIAGWSGDLTRGARNYYADYLTTPSWARGHQPSASWGHHLFFNDIP